MADSQTASPFSEELEQYIEDFDAWVRGGKTPDDAAIAARKFGLSAGECQALKEEYLKRNRRFIDLVDPHVLKGDERVETWYSGPDSEGSWCWPAYKQLLTDGSSGWDPDDFASLDRASTKILALLPHPAKPDFNCRGLVLGYVQSGKTANYSALISKAADAGYRLFIVLAGTTTSLRKQTQNRLEADIVRHHPTNWTWLTSSDSDFLGNPAGPDAIIDIHSHRKRVIAVVKKNGRVLSRLVRWIKLASIDTLNACPAIIIDDEADNASINTRGDENRPSAINKRIRDLLASWKKVAYVGYTATPFANIFIDPSVPEGLFPRDFIFDLEKPKRYFGAERIFGRDPLWFDEGGTEFDGLDMVREVSSVDPDEPAMLVPAKPKDRFDFEPEVPPSLEAAIRYFLLATAARYSRGHREKHSTMLVHTTMYVDLHDSTQEALDEVLTLLRRDHQNLRDELEASWAEESAKVPHPDKPAVSFDEIWAELPLVFERAEVLVDNGRVETALEYVKEKPRVVIAVGGNTFSRGLTLEGLVVSYYIRRACAYDTLLQMGRWFGYRFDYEDMPRVWMSNELQEQFLFLAGIEAEIRQDIRRLELEQRTPLELAIRVRTHPQLGITARNKMGAARLASVSYSDRRLQSFLFRHRDADWVASNMAAAARLGVKISDKVKEVGRGRYLARGVERDHVLEFLDAYKFHEDHEALRSDLLRNYISKENERGSLLEWNIAWIGRDVASDRLGILDMGIGRPLNCISRARFRMSEPCNIKALMSRQDRAVDLDGVDPQADDAALVNARNEKEPGRGFLVLYPISAASVPEGGRDRKLAECGTCRRTHYVPLDGAAVRHPLDAVGDLIAAAIVFPKAVRDEKEYMAIHLESIFDLDSPEEGEVIPDDPEGAEA